MDAGPSVSNCQFQRTYQQNQSVVRTSSTSREMVDFPLISMRFLPKSVCRWTRVSVSGPDFTDETDVQEASLQSLDVHSYLAHGPSLKYGESAYLRVAKSPVRGSSIYREYRCSSTLSVPNSAEGEMGEEGGKPPFGDRFPLR